MADKPAEPPPFDEHDVCDLAVAMVEAALDERGRVQSRLTTVSIALLMAETFLAGWWVGNEDDMLDAVRVLIENRRPSERLFVPLSHPHSSAREDTRG